MFVVTTIWVYALSILNAMLNCLNTRPAGAVLTTPKVDLYVNEHVPATGDVMSMYTLASFPGYAEATPTFTSAVTTGPDTSSCVASVTFTMTATGTVTGTCHGCVMSDGAGNFQGASEFSAPVLFAAPGDVLFLDVALPAMRQLNAEG